MSSLTMEEKLMYLQARIHRQRGEFLLWRARGARKGLPYPWVSVGEVVPRVMGRLGSMRRNDERGRQ